MTTTPAPSRRSERVALGGADHRLLRGYGPLAGLAVLFLVMVLLAPTVAPEASISSGAGRPGTGESVARGTPGGADVETPGAATPGDAEAGIPESAACPGFQLPTDPYSPPCATWPGGDNGGATTVGVTGDTITVTLRNAGLPDVGSVLAQFAGTNEYVSNQAEFERTVRVLIDHVNSHYELYGRRIELKVFKGQGSGLDEILGGGQSGAQADGIAASQEQHAFANLFTLTHPFADALAANGVVAIDNVFMARPWAAERAPFAWNTFGDCTKFTELSAEFAVNQLVGRPAAFAGTDLQSTTRRFGIIAPDSVVIQSCIEILESALRKAGADVRVVKFPPDLGTIQNSGQQIASSLKADGVTSVMLVTDPVTPLFFTSSAQNIDWSPEWVLVGYPYLDADYLAQIFPREQWRHTFGLSFAGVAQPPRASDAYRAYKAQSPDTEPAILLLPTIYEELRMLAIGIQLAGPNLTPQTFAQGLRSYQSTLGPDGVWAFPDGDFSARQDARIIWFDADATSPTNDRPGAYRDNGQRYALGTFPRGEPPVFLDGAP